MSGKRYKNNGENTETRIKFIRKLLPLLAVILVFAAAFYSDFQSYAADNEKDTLKLEQTIDQKEGKLTVTAEAEKDVLPEGTEMKVKAVGKTGDDYKAVEKRLKESADRQDRSLSGFLAYDISFWADGKEAEPDGKVDITMKWSDPVCPKGASKDDKVSVVHLEEKKDGGIKDSKVVDLTKSGKKDKEKNNKAKVDANRENEVRSAKITVDSFSVFAVQWTDSRSDEEKAAGNVKAPKIKVHYMDGYGKDIETAETVNFGTVTDREGNKILSKDIKGYDFKNARIGDVSTDSLKVDDGELFYKADGKWVRAQDSDLYLFYEKKSGDSKAGETEKDGKNSDQKKAQAEKPEYESGKLIAETEDYKATVSYGAGAKIPENAELRVYSLSKDEQAFKSAKAAVLETKGLGFDADSLGMKAVDISIMNNSEEYEPAEPVKVSIHMKNLPKDVDNVDVHHIPSSSMTAENALSNPIRKAPGLADKANAVMAAENIAVKKGDADTEFSVSGFSVFTITWTKGGTGDDKDSRIAQVKLHYVDEDGNEIAGPTETPAETIESIGSANGIVTIARDWAKDVTGYTYQEARLSDAKSGTVITHMQAEGTADSSSGKTTYSLKYSKDGTMYTAVPADDITGANNNQIDVYLVYEQQPHITIHHVNEAGKEVADSEVKYASELPSEVSDLSSWAKSDAGYKEYSYAYKGADGAHLTSTIGIPVSAVKAEKSGEDYIVQYRTSPDGEWKTAETKKNNIDLYLLYDRSDSDAKTITIHYVEKKTRSAITDENGNALTKVVYPDEWDSSDYDSRGSNNNGGVNGSYTTYVDMIKYAVSLDGYNEYKEPINGNSDSSVTQQYGADSRGFRYMRYTSDGNLFVGRGEAKDNKITNGEKVTFDSNNNVDVYQGYVAANTMSITVHHLDADGNKLADTTAASVTSGTEMSPSAFGTSIKGYAVDKGYLDSGRTTAFSSITYTGSGSSWSSSAAKADNTTDSALHREIWLTYKQQDSLSDLTKVIAHHVDANGNKLADDTVLTVSGTANFDNKWNGFGVFGNNGSVGSNFASRKNLGTPKAIYLGNTADASRQFIYENNNQDCIVFKYDEVTKKWYTGIGTTSGTPGPAEGKDYIGLINEITIVYPNSGNNLTVHYLHPVLDGDNKVLMGSDGNPTYRLFSGLADSEYPQTISYENIAGAGDDGIPLNADPTASESKYAKDITESTTEYNYSGSYLASPKTSPAAEAGLPGYARLTTDAPHVRKVRIHNGKYQFLVVSGDGTRTLTMTKRNQWSYTTTGGRTYTLRKSGNTFTMLDSQAGRSAYDLNLTSTTENSNDETVNIYTGKSGAEGVGIEYSVKETKNPTGTSYELTVSEWSDSVQNNIYQVYVKKTDAPVVTVSNEVVYSGNLTARAAGMDGKTVVSYTWEKQINGGEWKEVTRKQTGNNWNIANNLKGRSWLNLTADEGELSRSEGRTGVKYRVVLTYKDSDDAGETKTTTSEEFSVPYWDQLENGSFEMPSKDSDSKDYLAPTKDGDYSNSDYKSKGVWQTTGPGTGNQAGKDIEIINTKTQGGFRGSYGWPQGKNDGAKDGEQFAELNCEASGALYQDVITQTNEYLNYWLSHRARGGTSSPAANAAPKYDSMYLVIMPTKLAMTSGSDGGELKTQDDLKTFINSHAKGGYSTTGPGREENEVVCRDTNSGVLIVKISSDNQDWHSIDVTNGYIATSSLTRFFFVAGYTSYNNNPTVGNMLDAVGFSQKLPTPETPNYHVVVKKTFSGLTASDIAKLASNAKDSSGNTIADSFKLTIHETDGNGAAKENMTAESLDGTELSFTADSSKNFTLTAKQGRKDMMTGSSTGVVSEDPDTGDVTMTWTLYNNSYNDDLHYTIEESGEDLNGYSTAVSNSGTVEHGKTDADPASTEIPEKNGTKTGAIAVTDQDTVRVNYRDVYRDNQNSDPRVIRVAKTFTGITPSVVNNLTGAESPYRITLKNESSSELKLVGNAQNPVDGNYPDGVDDVELSIKANMNGTSTYIWTITGERGDGSWVKENGKYSVKEENFTPSENNAVTSIDINGAKSTGTNPGVTVSGTGTSAIAEKSEIATGSGSGLSLDAEKRVVEDIPTGTKILDEGTNIILAQDSNGYLVWTPDILGENARAAVISKINALQWTTTKPASESNVGFRSGQNPGKITISGTNRTMTYNSNTRELKFDGSTNADTWNQYFAASYTLKRDNSTVSNDDSEIRITNSYEPAIRIIKTSESSTNAVTLLGGAEFKLFKMEGNDRRYYVEGTGGSTEEFEANAENEGTAYTTSSDPAALGIKDLPTLTEGIYYLEETKAPDGYNKLTNPVAFKMNEDGSVVAADKDASDNSKIGGIPADTVTPDWNSPYYTLTISNTPGDPLPLTGGRGIWPFIIAGLVLALAATYGLWKRKHRYVGRHEAN